MSSIFLWFFKNWFGDSWIIDCLVCKKKISPKLPKWHLERGKHGSVAVVHMDSFVYVVTVICLHPQGGSVTNNQSEGDSCLCCCWSLAAIDKTEIISCERCESETLVSHAVITICVSSISGEVLYHSLPVIVHFSTTQHTSQRDPHVVRCGFLKEHAQAHLLRLEIACCVSLGYWYYWEESFSLLIF